VIFIVLENADLTSNPPTQRLSAFLRPFGCGEGQRAELAFDQWTRVIGRYLIINAYGGRIRPARRQFMLR
jgi:hypothetical protein